jgi:hypothetical protein
MSRRVLDKKLAHRDASRRDVAYGKSYVYIFAQLTHAYSIH